MAAANRLADGVMTGIFLGARESVRDLEQGIGRVGHGAQGPPSFVGRVRRSVSSLSASKIYARITADCLGG